MNSKVWLGGGAECPIYTPVIPSCSILQAGCDEDLNLSAGNMRYFDPPPSQESSFFLSVVLGHGFKGTLYHFFKGLFMGGGHGTYYSFLKAILIF